MKLRAIGLQVSFRTNVVHSSSNARLIVSAQRKLERKKVFYQIVATTSTGKPKAVCQLTVGHFGEAEAG